MAKDPKTPGPGPKTTGATVPSSTPDDAARDVPETRGSQKASARATAQAFLDQYQESQREQAEAQKAEDEEAYQYFYRCHTCNQPGIFFTKNPIAAEIRDHEWFASYKGLDEAYVDDEVLCQVCLQRGRETSLYVNRMNRHQATREQLRGHPFRVFGSHEERHLNKFPKDPERLKREGILRAGETFEADESKVTA